MIKQTKGFTLVEVAVVLVILAILATLTIPNVTGWVDDSKERRIISEAKVAVKTAEGIAAKAYASDKNNDLDSLLSGSNVQEESGLKGIIEGIEVKVSDNKSNEILHLSYTNYDITVTYCAHPNNCTTSKNASLHTKKYNFVAAEDFTIAGETTTPPAVEPTPSPPATIPSPPATVPSPPATNIDENYQMDGFEIDSIDGKKIFVIATDIYQYGQDKAASNNSGSFEVDGGNIISIKDNGEIRYFFIRYTCTFPRAASSELLLTKLTNNSHIYEMPSKPVLVPYDSKIKSGQICYHTDLKSYYIYLPDSQNKWNGNWNYTKIKYNPPKVTT